MIGGDGHKFPCMASESAGFSFSIWLPTKRTPDTVVKRVVDTLVGKPYPLMCKRYGAVPAADAELAQVRWGCACGDGEERGGWTRRKMRPVDARARTSVRTTVGAAEGFLTVGDCAMDDKLPLSLSLSSPAANERRATLVGGGAAEQRGSPGEAHAVLRIREIHNSI